MYKRQVEGTFEGKLNGVFYKKKAMATATGAGLLGKLQEKALTKAGAGMWANPDPHSHDNTRKTDEKDEITITGGTFSVVWADKKARQ